MSQSLLYQGSVLTDMMAGSIREKESQSLLYQGSVLTQTASEDI